jgi:nitrogen regulatory protein P-II 1
MKKIEAIISPSKLEVVRESLLKIGIQRMTVSEVRDFGRQEAHTEVYRGSEYKVEYLIKVRVETVVPQHLAHKAISIMMKKGQSGKTGSDSIFVSNVNDVSQVYTNGTGESV